MTERRRHRMSSRNGVGAQLFKYNAVVFFSTSRDTLDDPAQTSLRQYVRGGGGFVGIHNAFGTEYNWPWYEGLLGGANFYDHGPLQSGTVHVVDHKDSSTAGLPDTWTFTDEWYNLIPFQRRHLPRRRGVPEADRRRHRVGHGQDPVLPVGSYGGRDQLIVSIRHPIPALRANFSSQVTRVALSFSASAT